MGMRLYLRAAGPQTLDRIQGEQDVAAEYLFGDMPELSLLGQPGNLMTLDKSWHAIHFLLTGRAGGGPWPECFLLHGGTEVPGTDIGYGPVRTLTSEQVREVFKMLSPLPSIVLRDRFDPRALHKAEIYPGDWHRNSVDWDNVSDHYERLRRAFADAVLDDAGMVLCIS